LRLIPDGTPKAKHQRLNPKGSAAQNRRAQGQDPACKAASHEDTSRIRPEPCGPSLSASVT